MCVWVGEKQRYHFEAMLTFRVSDAKKQPNEN